MPDRKRGEKSCPEEGPHAWQYDVFIQRTVCLRCGILERWLAAKQIRDREHKTAKRLVEGK